MSDILSKLIGKNIIIGDMYNGKFISSLITNFQYRKKYPNINISNLENISQLLNSTDFEYLVIFNDVSKHNNLINVKNIMGNLIDPNKIIFIDGLCKLVLRPPFDCTIEKIVDNLEDTYSYIFGYDYYAEKWDESKIILSLLKILKYLKLNLLTDFELFKPILKNNNDSIRIISFNVFNSNPDLKKYETIRQIAHLKYINPDIMFLQECSSEIEKSFDEYDFINTPSHCGNTYLLIKKVWETKINDCICQDGIILSWVSTIYGDFVLGSLHMVPYDDEEDILFRLEQIEMFQDWITDNNLTNIPVIIGGDTNMTTRESSYIKNCGVFTEWSNPSYPNREIIYKKAKQYSNTFSQTYNYDKYFLLNVNVNNFATINTFDSDHLMNYLSIIIK